MRLLAWLRRLAVGMIVVAALWPATIPPAPTPAAIAAQGASLVEEGGWLRLTLVGTPYQMGEQQGTLLRPYLRDLLATQLYPTMVGAGLSVREVQRYGRLVARGLPAPWLEEMRGIAAGAGVPWEEVLLWNLRDEWLMLGADLPFVVREAAPRWLPPLRSPLSAAIHGGQQPWPAPLPARPATDPATSVALALRDATGARGVAASIAAPPGGARFLLVVRRPAEGPALAGVALPGEVGLYGGSNEAGVGVAMVPFATVDRGITGLPAPLLVRATLAQARTGAEAAEVAQALPRLGGSTLLIAGASGGLQRVTLAARQSQVVGGEEAAWLVASPPVEGALAASVAPLGWTTPPATGRIAAWWQANQGVGTVVGLLSLFNDPTVPGPHAGATWLWLPEEGTWALAQAAEGQPAPASGWVTFDPGEWWP